MGGVMEIKEAAQRLSPDERLQLANWLAESADVKGLRLDELRRELALGIAQADRGEMKDGAEVFARLRTR